MFIFNRRHLRIVEKSIVFLPCYAYQINLCIGEIFKELTNFKKTIDQAVYFAIYFRNSIHKFFIAKLKDKQYAEYKKYFVISMPRETG